MGRYMISVCCICGAKAKCFNDDEWSYQDFCPPCSEGLFLQVYSNPPLNMYINDK